MSRYYPEEITHERLSLIDDLISLLHATKRKLHEYPPQAEEQIKLWFNEAYDERIDIHNDTLADIAAKYCNCPNCTARRAANPDNIPDLTGKLAVSPVRKREGNVIYLSGPQDEENDNV